METIKTISSGIYIIICTKNGRFYIGSSNDIRRRWNEHKRKLMNNKHHSILLQRSYNKYGIGNFDYRILEEVNEEKLLEVEQIYMDLLNAYDKNVGFNISHKASNNAMRGEKHPLYGVGHKPETILKMKGRVFSDEHKKRLSLSSSNRTGMNNPMYGKECSDHVKAASSKHNKGRFRGEKSPRATITQDIANKIKELYPTGNYTQHELANMFKTSRGVVSSIIYGRSWK